MKKNRSFRIKVFSGRHLFLLLFLMMLWFSSCKTQPEPYTIVEFAGSSEIYNYSKSFGPVIYEADSMSSTALLVSEGDIIAYGLNMCLRYNESSGKVLTVNTADDTGFINGKIHSVKIPDDDEMIPWFKQLNSMDISSLEFLDIESPLNENYFPYLSELAELRPEIGIGYEGDLRDLDRISEIFKLRYIVGANISGEDLDILSRLTSLEFLSVTLRDTIFTAPLPAMPQLKHLFLTDIGKNNIPDYFFKNNTQLEKLTIHESDNFDLLAIASLSNLRELIISEADTIENFDLISNHKRIELLSVEGYESHNNHIMRDLPHLRWISFHEDATQQDFTSIIDRHPDLEVVEIINNDAINNLQPLLKLRKLSGLTIAPDTVTDLASIKSLKNLKYLSIPSGVLADSTLEAELLKSLPRTKIVANEGVCLGSGWLLLLIPIILFLRVFTLRKS
jgi:hypothetical protein